MYKAVHNAIFLMQTVFNTVEIIQVAGLITAKYCIGDMIGQLDDSRCFRIDKQRNFHNTAQLISPSIPRSSDRCGKILQTRFRRHIVDYDHTPDLSIIFLKISL